MENDAIKERQFEKYGFQFGKKTVHTSRTIMFAELNELFIHVSATADVASYKRAIIEDNCLLKRSMSNRKRTAEHLIELYSLDPNIPVFRGLRYFWNKDIEARKQLAVLCAYSRDTLFRASAPVILNMPINDVMTIDRMQPFMEEISEDRFSQATLKSLSQSINSSWTQVDYVEGKVKKIRKPIEPKIGAVAYALFLGYLQGARGLLLFETEFIKTLDCSRELAIEKGEQAAKQGWINQKRIGTVVENSFPQIIEI